MNLYFPGERTPGCSDRPPWPQQHGSGERQEDDHQVRHSGREGKENGYF